VRNDANLGFAKANNKVFLISKGKILAFLNSDTIIFENSLNEIVNSLMGSSDVGIVGIQLIDDKGEVVKSRVKFPTFSMFLTKILGLYHLFPPGLSPIYFMYDFNSSRLVDQVSGAFFS